MCLGLASGYVPPKEPPKYEVEGVVCDYGVFENGELMDGLILNSRANALLIAEILTADAKHEIHNQAACAEWKEVKARYGKWYECTACGNKALSNEIEYCNRCGARMRLKS